MRQPTFRCSCGDCVGPTMATHSLLAFILFAVIFKLVLSLIYVKIETGYEHTCAITSAGALKCWGGNAYGQIEDGTLVARNIPTDVTGLSSSVSLLACGQYHTCAVTTTGTMQCWGINSDGQLGDSTTTARLTPTSVSGLTSGVTAIAAGFAHTCAIISGGTVKCWGNNAYGQLGDGSTTSRISPGPVSGLTDASFIASGNHYVCVVTTSGAVKCWGYNIYSQLGDGTTTNSIVPLSHPSLTSGVSVVACGGPHTCVIISSTGEMKCWGYNNKGLVLLLQPLRPIQLQDCLME